MKKSILFLLLALSLSTLVYSQKAQDTYTQTEIDLKLQLQQQKAKTSQEIIHKEIELLKKENELQRVAINENLESTRQIVTWAVAILGILVSILGILAAIFGYFINQRVNRNEEEVKKEVEIVKKQKEEAIKLRGEVKEVVERLKMEVQKELETTINLRKEVEDIITKTKKDSEIIEQLRKKAETARETINSPNELTIEQKRETQETVEEIVEEIAKIKSETEYSANDWFLKGWDAANNEEYENACDYYEKSIGLEEDSDAYNNWGNALSSLAMLKDSESLYEESIEKFQKTIDLKPNDSVAYYICGIALLELATLKGKLDKYAGEIESKLLAAEELKKGIGSSLLACLYSLLNDKEKAFEWLEKGLQYEGRNNRAFYEKDENFNNIKEDSRFNQLLDKYFPTKK